MSPAPEGRLPGELPYLLRRLADELERSASVLRLRVPVLWCDLTVSGLVAMAAAEIDRLALGWEPAAPSGEPASVAELDRLRAALDRIAREAVVPIAGRLDRWEWAVGRVCSCTYFTRDEACAGFRRRFGLKGG